MPQRAQVEAHLANSTRFRPLMNNRRKRLFIDAVEVGLATEGSQQEKIRRCRQYLEESGEFPWWLLEVAIGVGAARLATLSAPPNCVERTGGSTSGM